MSSCRQTLAADRFVDTVCFWLRVVDVLFILIQLLYMLLNS